MHLPAQQLTLEEAVNPVSGIGGLGGRPGLALGRAELRSDLDFFVFSWVPGVIILPL